MNNVYISFSDDRIKFKKSRRYSYVSNPAFSSNNLEKHDETNGDNSRMESTISDPEKRVQHQHQGNDLQGSVDFDEDEEDDDDEEDDGDYDDHEIESATKVQVGIFKKQHFCKKTVERLFFKIQKNIKKTILIRKNNPRLLPCFSYYKTYPNIRRNFPKKMRLMKVLKND